MLRFASPQLATAALATNVILSNGHYALLKRRHANVHSVCVFFIVCAHSACTQLIPHPSLCSTRIALLSPFVFITCVSIPGFHLLR